MTPVTAKPPRRIKIQLKTRTSIRMRNLMRTLEKEDVDVFKATRHTRPSLQ
jgi:hypothetical protein